MHTYRFVYNKALGAVKRKEIRLNKMELRNKLVTESTRTTNPDYKNYSFYKNTFKTFSDFSCCNVRELLQECLDDYTTEVNYLNHWEKSTPKTIRQQAVYEMENAYSTQLKMFKQGKKPFFDMKYKKRKYLRSLTFRFDCTNAWKIKEKQLVLFSGYKDKPWDPVIEIGKRDVKRLLKIPKEELSNNGSITYSQGQWHFIVAHSRVVPKRELPNEPKAVGVDLGVRSFATCYSPDRVSTLYQPREVLQRLRKQINQLKSLRRSQHKNVRRGMCKREKRIDNLVTETHWKSIRYLLKEYDAVFLGDIESQGVLQGKLNGTTKNELQSLSFYRFKQRLLEKAQQEKKMVFFTHEAYTSKSCTYCGTLHEVKSSKTFACPSCTAVYDRDEGGARNIYMKTLLSEGVKFMSLTS